MLPRALSDPLLGPSYVLSEAQSVCYFPDLLQLDGCCAGPHNAILRSHTWRVRTSCLTTQQTIRPMTSD